MAENRESESFWEVEAGYGRRQSVENEEFKWRKFSLDEECSWRELLIEASDSGRKEHWISQITHCTHYSLFSSTTFKI